jgi:LacI family transcriptional regulator
MSKNNERVRLADVAALAGASPATVSRFLANPFSIKEKRRKPIEDAIAKLGYVPNAAARTLASKSSRLIGAVFPRLDSLLFGVVYEPLQKQLSEGGYTLVVSSSDYDPDTEYQQVLSLISNSVDALILVGTSHHDKTLELIRNAEIPLVLVACWDETFPIPQVGFSNEAGAGKMADYLVSIGHTRIGAIAGSQKTNERAEARLNGIRQALKTHCIQLQNHNVFRCEFSFENGGIGLRRLIDQNQPPTAIICGSDMLAAGCIFEAQRMGLRVPEDISITGFDDIELSRQIHPQLTTIRTPRREVAEEAARLLLEKLSGNTELHSIKLETKLMVRGSTAPPKST